MGQITYQKCPRDGNCPQTCTPFLEEPIPGKPDHFWVLVSLTTDGGQQYYVLADDKVRTLLREDDTAYLKQNGGQRPGKNHDSPHCMLTDKGLHAWKDKWATLGLGPLSLA